jgi:hypothetical protein
LGLSNISNNFVTKNQINLKFNVIRRYRNELLDNERHVVFKYALLGVNFYVKRKKNYRFFIKKFQKLNRPPKIHDKFRKEFGNLVSEKNYYSNTYTSKKVFELKGMVDS